MSSVLIVDDEPHILCTLGANLKARHHTVTVASDGGTALCAASVRPPDLIVLDLGLPDMDGIDVIRRLRSWTSTPIIVLSGRCGQVDKVEALNAGADDYLTKPFSMTEFIARMGAVLRRPTPIEERQRVEVGEYTMDLTSYTVTPKTGRHEVPHLTPTEWRLLATLLRNPGKVMSNQRLLHEVWGPGHEHHTNYLRVYIATLRSKLESHPSHPQHLITTPGMGYRFEP